MRHDSKCVDLSCHGLQTTRSIEINGESASKIMRKKDVTNVHKRKSFLIKHLNCQGLK